jgi:hypothetical protein
MPNRVRSDTSDGEEEEERPEEEPVADEAEGQAESEEETTEGVEPVDSIGPPMPERIDEPPETDMPMADADEEVARDAEAGASEPPDSQDVVGTKLQESLDVLINTIPGEILVLWAAFEGAAELYSLPVWAYSVLLVLTAVATPVYVYRSIERPDDATKGFDEQVWEETNVRWQSISATGAFLVWVYYLGGPFQLAGLQDAALATVLVLVYPVVIVISPFYGSLLLHYLSGGGSNT